MRPTEPRRTLHFQATSLGLISHPPQLISASLHVWMHTGPWEDQKCIWGGGTQVRGLFGEPRCEQDTAVGTDRMAVGCRRVGDKRKVISSHRRSMGEGPATKQHKAGWDMVRYCTNVSARVRCPLQHSLRRWGLQRAPPKPGQAGERPQRDSYIDTKGGIPMWVLDTLGRRADACRNQGSLD